MKSFRILFASALILFVSGCTPQIPNKVTTEEYAVYRSVLAQRFESRPPKQLILPSRTTVEDPLASGMPNACGDKIHKAGVSWALIKELHEVGSAEYPLSFGYVPDSGSPKIPEKSLTVSEGIGLYSDYKVKRGEFNLFQFTRVAFNRTKTEGLFFFEESNGQNGWGGYRLAKLVDGQWTFEKVGCDWVSIID